MIDSQPKTFFQRLKNLYSLYFSTVKSAFSLMLFATILILALEFGLVFLLRADIRFSTNIASIFSVVLLLIFIPAMLYKANAIANGGSAGFKEAFSFGLYKSPLCLVVALISLVAIGVGLVLLIIPGLFMVVACYSFTSMVLVDGAPVLSSLKQAIKMTWGSAWRQGALILSYLIPILIVFMLIQVVIGFIYGLVSVLVFNVQPGNGLSFYLVVTISSTFLTSVLMQPAFPSACVVLYRDLKARNQVKTENQQVESPDSYEEP